MKEVALEKVVPVQKPAAKRPPKKQPHNANRKRTPRGTLAGNLAATKGRSR